MICGCSLRISSATDRASIHFRLSMPRASLPPRMRDEQRPTPCRRPAPWSAPGGCTRPSRGRRSKLLGLLRGTSSSTVTTCSCCTFFIVGHRRAQLLHFARTEDSCITSAASSSPRRASGLPPCGCRYHSFAPTHALTTLATTRRIFLGQLASPASGFRDSPRLSAFRIRPVRRASASSFDLPLRSAWPAAGGTSTISVEFAQHRPQHRTQHAEVRGTAARCRRAGTWPARCASSSISGSLPPRPRFERFGLACRRRRTALLTTFSVSPRSLL